MVTFDQRRAASPRALARWKNEHKLDNVKMRTKPLYRNHIEWFVFSTTGELFVSNSKTKLV